MPPRNPPAQEHAPSGRFRRITEYQLPAAHRPEAIPPCMPRSARHRQGEPQERGSFAHNSYKSESSARFHQHRFYLWFGNMSSCFQRGTCLRLRSFHVSVSRLSIRFPALRSEENGLTSFTAPVYTTRLTCPKRVRHPVCFRPPCYRVRTSRGARWDRLRFPHGPSRQRTPRGARS